jgi:hypothetical protein
METLMKKLFLTLALLFTFSCEDARVEEPMSMKLWLNGEEVDVASEYQRITTFAEQTEYVGDDSSITLVKKILVIHFQKDAGRLELNKEHYAVIFVDWNGDSTNGLPIDRGVYPYPGVESDKKVFMEIIGAYDYSISGEAHIESITESGDTWKISGDGEGIFYNPYAEANMEGRIEFENLKIEIDEDDTTPYSDYGGH